MHLCSPHQLHTSDCATVFRRFVGPEAREVYALCEPDATATGVAGQAEAAYRAALDLLAAEGASLETVACETVHLADVREDLAAVLEARSRVLARAGLRPDHLPTTLVEQRPLADGAGLALAVHAVVPHGRQAWSAGDVLDTSRCACAGCTRPRGRLVRLAGQTQLWAGNIHGTGRTAFDEVYGMFCAAESLLDRAGMGFRDVVRTWIYLRDMDRDYPELNLARRAFFRDRGIDVRPASTGVGGGPAPAEHDFALGLYAVQSPRPLEVGVMSTRSLGEAWLYGSDFSRGLRVVEANRIALYVSGTASIDEAGDTVHVGDLVGQTDRMLANVAGLLDAQGASFRDVVSAVTYVKRRSDAAALRAVLRDQGFDGFPNVLVEAPICRPDLLCETEVVAALPLPRPV